MEMTIVSIPCTRLDLICRKIHDLRAMDLAPSPTPGAMKLGPIEYKESHNAAKPICGDQMKPTTLKHKGSVTQRVLFLTESCKLSR